MALAAGEFVPPSLLHSFTHSHIYFLHLLHFLRAKQMNHLAHAFLSDGTTASVLGSLMGDFVKGPLDDRYAPDVTRGLLLHRRVDSYTDGHPIVAGSRARIGRERRRFAGILVDMFYDHFLALHWMRFADVPLEQFTARVYTILLEHRSMLPDRLQLVAPYMTQGDWLGSYREVDAIGMALDRMGQRLKRGNALLGSGDELRKHYAALEHDFLAFFPDVVRFAKQIREEMKR